MCFELQLQQLQCHCTAKFMCWINVLISRSVLMFRTAGHCSCFCYQAKLFTSPFSLISYEAGLKTEFMYSKKTRKRQQTYDHLSCFCIYLHYSVIFFSCMASILIQPVFLPLMLHLISSHWFGYLSTWKDIKKMRNHCASSSCLVTSSVQGSVSQDWV